MSGRVGAVTSGGGRVTRREGRKSSKVEGCDPQTGVECLKRFFAEPSALVEPSEVLLVSVLGRLGVRGATELNLGLRDVTALSRGLRETAALSRGLRDATALSLAPKSDFCCCSTAPQHDLLRSFRMGGNAQLDEPESKCASPPPRALVSASDGSVAFASSGSL